MIKKNTNSSAILAILCLALLLLSACTPTGQATDSNGYPPAGASPQNAYPVNPTAVMDEATATVDELISTPAPTATLAPEISEADLENGTYLMTDFSSMNGGSDQVTLINGKYAYKDPTNPPDPSNFTVQYQKSAIGDLNGDSTADAAVVLVADTSGSGTFIYLAAVIAGEDGFKNVATAYLGDRVVVESVAIQDDVINLQMITHGPQDPLCCPSLKTSETYQLVNGRLVTQAEKIAAPLADGVIQALKANDMKKLASFVDPAGGVRFSPYTNVKNTDLVFSKDQLANIANDQTVYGWGNYDGSGESIQLTFGDYNDRFVYSMNFASASMVGYNRTFSSGNMIDNSRDFYAGAIIVEYYLPGTNTDYGGMDWQSLKLVFQQNTPAGSNSAGQWYLVGIIHNQWTI